MLLEKRSNDWKHEISILREIYFSLTCLALENLTNLPPMLLVVADPTSSTFTKSRLLSTNITELGILRDCSKINRDLRMRSNLSLWLHSFDSLVPSLEINQVILVMILQRITTKITLDDGFLSFSLGFLTYILKRKRFKVINFISRKGSIK